ncbi:hypothetical protein KBB96_11240 [Luteolibacter ambystomatis]|uniref:DUF6797 domain-containing protein n=2 Tax=Luteolibacter ambystomatis TaxID=2824561 RepID=A0A975G610_9BACT|nr:DUF6797 domain-containing protein [Luteolibacter ambystomatis]QUE49447.1 hypothetical protein KBB96_11240 [Luteolibacter ambystomatis]
MSKTASIIATFAASTAALHAANWYEEMQIGPAWSNTFDDTFQGQKRLAAVKGILLDLGDGQSHALFDTETLGLVNAYSGFVHWGGTPWTGKHAVLVALADETPVFNTARGTAKWADAKGSFEDSRKIPGYGNFDHARFNGYFRSGSTIVLDYTVLGSRVLETVAARDGTVTRSFDLAERKSDLTTVAADEAKPFTVAADGLSAKSEDGLTVTTKGGKLAADPKSPGRLLLRFAKGDKTTAQVAYARGAEPKPAAAPDFATLLKGGAPLWKDKITTEGKVSTDTREPYATDIATLPTGNPWKANLRFGGFDFIDDDSAALSAWNGDVWVVKGLKGDWKQLVWQRVASGLFEPLGVKVVNGIIHVNGRDQITQLIDLNGDGEIDQFKAFNRDVYVTENFHEFAFDLQTDKQGNFYFSKAGPVKSGGRGFDKTLPNNGTINKVSADGKKLEVVATGLRAPGGVGVGPNGEISAGENEGSWEPACKINFARASELPVFFGCEPTRQELGKGKPYTEPLCYLPMDMDNSGASQVWVPEGAKFGVNPGEMLHLSYGQSSIYRVLPQRAGDRLQAGVSSCQSSSSPRRCARASPRTARCTCWASAAGRPMRPPSARSSACATPASRSRHRTSMK